MGNYRYRVWREGSDIILETRPGDRLYLNERAAIGIGTALLEKAGVKFIIHDPDDKEETVLMDVKGIRATLGLFLAGLATKEQARSAIDLVAQLKEYTDARALALEIAMSRLELKPDYIVGILGHLREPPKLSDTEALDAMKDLLDKREWDSETMSTIAGLIRATGREVDDVSE